MSERQTDRVPESETDSLPPDLRVPHTHAHARTHIPRPVPEQRVRLQGPPTARPRLTKPLTGPLPFYPAGGPTGWLPLRKHGRKLRRLTQPLSSRTLSEITPRREEPQPWATGSVPDQPQHHQLWTAGSAGGKALRPHSSRQDTLSQRPRTSEQLYFTTTQSGRPPIPSQL